MKRHRLDPASLVFGFVFTVIGSIYVGGKADLTTVRLSWLVPAGLVLVGSAITASAIRRARAGDEE